MKRYISIFALFLVFNITAGANDGSYNVSGRGGGSLVPVKNNAIVMEKEVILIDVYRKSETLFDVKFDCTFFFKNTVNSVQKVTMGFPHGLNAHMEPDYDKGGANYKRLLTDPVVNDFTFVVDEKSTDFRALRADVNTSMNEVPAYDVVYAADVVFAAGEKKKIRNTYSMRCEYSAWPALYPSQRDDRNTNFFDYILLTGLTWKEPIGQADISITFHVPEDTFAVTLSPPGYTASADGLRFSYHYESFQPEKDIHAVFTFKKPEIRQVENLVKKYMAADINEAAYLLLLQWDVTTLYDKKSKKEKDIIRNLAYKLAEKYFRTDAGKAGAMYMTAVRHTYSYNEKEDTNAFLLDMESIKPATPFSKWESEGESNSPCYYIFYNIACLKAMEGYTGRAGYWLNVASSINPKLTEMAKKDKDLENLAYKDNPLQSALGKRTHLEVSEIEPLLGKEYINSCNLFGTTPLMQCINRFYMEGESSNALIVCRKLLEKGADVNVKDRDGQTALHLACKYLQYQDITRAIEMLVQYKADVHAADENGDIPLSVAFARSYSGNSDISFLIRNTKKINSQNRFGITPLMYALQNSFSAETIKQLLDKGADPGITDNYGMTSLHYLCLGASVSVEPEKILKLIVPRIKDINKQDKSGKTALHYFCEFYSFDYILTSSDNKAEDIEKAKKLIVYFLDNKADMSLTDYRGFHAYESLPGLFRKWYTGSYMKN